jgi:Fe-S-cluster containining protein
MSEPGGPAKAAEFAYKITARSLRRSTDVDSCVALAAQLDERLDATLAEARSLGAPIACQAGCSFCCRARVTVTPHEAIALFRYLRSQISAEKASAIASNVLVNAERIGPLTETEHRSARIPCAFLVDDRCSAYAARPAVCAGYHSLDRNECESSYNNPADLSARIPMLETVRQNHGAMEQGMFKALEELKLSSEPMELHTAVAALLRDPGLISRWRSGRSWPTAQSKA